jgi:hypothetical protein
MKTYGSFSLGKSPYSREVMKIFKGWLKIEHNKGSIEGSKLEVEITLIKESSYYKREES